MPTVKELQDEIAALQAEEAQEEAQAPSFEEAKVNRVTGTIAPSEVAAGELFEPAEEA